MRSLDVPALEMAMHNLHYPAFVAMTKSEDTVEGPKAFAEKATELPGFFLSLLAGEEY